MSNDLLEPMNFLREQCEIASCIADSRLVDLDNVCCDLAVAVAPVMVTSRLAILTRFCSKTSRLKEEVSRLSISFGSSQAFRGVFVSSQQQLAELHDEIESSSHFSQLGPRLFRQWSPITWESV